ncbi:MAG: class I SAM-dependent methyltransferase [Pseudomonadota bacterium]
MTSPKEDWASRVRDVYSRRATDWDERRDRSLFERTWLDRFLEATPPGSAILDLGCGGGEPISGYMIDAGRSLTGVDFAPPMLAIARSRFPQATWVEVDMRDLNLGRTFGGVVSWGGFFHLNREEQRLALPRIARHVASPGALLLTVGREDGEVYGCVADEPAPHASLSPEEYASILAKAGMRIDAFVPDDPACRGHSLLLARKD